MISTKKLMKMAKKWQKFAAASRKRISFPKREPTLEKGCFVVYTTDERRFAIPLAYLESEIFRELLRMAEEEFGLSGDRAITMPCDSVLLEYALSVIQRGVGREIMDAFLLSLSHCQSLSSSLHYEQIPVICC